jgi:hypothetical protein
MVILTVLGIIVGLLGAGATIAEVVVKVRESRGARTPPAPPHTLRTEPTVVVALAVGMCPSCPKSPA